MASRRGAVLEVALRQEVSETAPGFPFFVAQRAPLWEVEEAVHRAASDPKVTGLVLRVDSLGLGWAKAQSLHRAVSRFRAAGKPSLAVVSAISNAAYLVASAAERVLLDPSATLDLGALESESFFFTDVLGALGVDPELDRVGEYKSGGEMFRRRESSEPHRAQMDALLSDLEAQFFDAVAQARGIGTDAVAEAVARGPLLPEEALALRLVDEIGTADDTAKEVEARFGRRARVWSQERYLRRGRLRRFLGRWRRPRIAVVHAVGVIVSGEGGAPAGGRRSLPAAGIVEILATLRGSRRVKGVVLRVDSPGGGAVASDRIRRAVEAMSKAKPVVISMGDVAASGGYFLATGGTAIVAEGATLTGSIGVIGGKFVLRRLLDRLGIHSESHRTGENPNFYSPFRSFREDERARHREFLRHFYERNFLPAVAAGRGFDLDRADALGRGRVWTGRQALERELVDGLGGLHEAVELACVRAGVPRAKARIVFYGPRRRVSDFLRLGALALRGRAPLDALAEALSLGGELGREKVLLLMSPTDRIE